MADSQPDSKLFSVRIVSIDHYMAPPIPDYDFCYSNSQGDKVHEVPIIRVHIFNTSLSEVFIEGVLLVLVSSSKEKQESEDIMGLMSNKIDRQKLKPGDHIYCWRKAFIYAHHGIYVGNRKVIHFTQGPAGQENGSVIISSCLPDPKMSDVPCPQCGDHKTSFNNGVILSCIDCFLSGGELKLFEYGVSRAYFLADVRGGTCTLAASDPPGDVLHRANILLKNGFGDYDMFKNNCEDFAIYCKTGLLVIIPSTRGGQSGQAASFEAASGLIVSSLALLTYKFKGVAAVSSGVYYCYSRLNSDIGVRSDVAKVPVESLVPPPPPPPPPPAVSYGTSIDQGIAYVLMLVALFNQLRDSIRQIHHPARAIDLVAEILIFVFGVGACVFIWNGILFL
ncbi:hypothetical protein LWI29_024565 [Acer saccharum]|uniref:LRAT domain-containing protein n=1 Tax=Acer saccharum TaxID=4024 RepID=A0AA39T5B2_ACESA|nr:hypothetical protein LWI29_024565 [Acer saccharum]